MKDSMTGGINQTAPTISRSFINYQAARFYFCSAIFTFGAYLFPIYQSENDAQRGSWVQSKGL
jgi:hypothetical protein